MEHRIEEILEFDREKNKKLGAHKQHLTTKSIHEIFVSEGFDIAESTIIPYVLKKVKKYQETFMALHGDAVKSITCDHGTEFANSLFINQIENTYQSKIYFAHAYTPQERGTNENTNGLVRAFLPKKLTFESKTQADMIFIANELNTSPKKIHGFSTCKEIYERECAALNNSP